MFVEEVYMVCMLCGDRMHVYGCMYGCSAIILIVIFYMRVFC